MGKQRKDPPSGNDDPLVTLRALRKKDQVNFLKEHQLLQTCSKEQQDELPKPGQLVWARVLGSVFWPGFILELKDVDISSDPTYASYTHDIDDTAYAFVMFLEKTYRYAPVSWDHMIPFQNLESQIRLLPYLNKVVIKKTWKPTVIFKNALQMAVEFSEMSPSQRLTKALTKYEAERKLHAHTRSPGVAVKAPKKSDTPSEEDIASDKVISQVLASAKEKKKSGIRVSERNVKKQIGKLKPKPSPKQSVAKKTEKPGDGVKAALKNNKNARPDTGGEVLKAWTKNRFNSFCKNYNFESSNVQCGKCDQEIKSEDTNSFTTCHGIQYHNDCLVLQASGSYKCKMCIEQQCFLCKFPGSKDKQALKCSRCDLRFHIDCLLKDWPQAEIQGSGGPITCPVHYCHTCLGEQKINLKFRDYTTSNSRSYRCRLCLSTYHKTCLPAGCGENIQGKEYVVCPRHTLPELKVHQRRVGCFLCFKAIKAKEEKVDCSFCNQAFHPACVGYTDEIKRELSVEVFGQGYKCFACKWGLFPVYGQIVWFQQPQSQYWAARILFPAEAKARNSYAKRQPGQYSIEYFGSTQYYDNASRALPIHCTSLELLKTLKVYQEVSKNVRAFEEAGFCYEFMEEFRDKQLQKPKPIYKKIEKNLYRTVAVQKVKEPADVCGCADDKAEFVCQADSGCANRDMEMECTDRICTGKARCCNRMFSERKNDEEFLEQKLFPKKGWGVIAKKPFKYGDFVAEYRGEVIDRNEMMWRMSKKEEEDPMYIMELSKVHYIDAEYLGNLSRLINHSCDPNCEVRKYLSQGRSVGGIFARRDIAVGEELTFKYGCGNNSAAAFACRCGAKNCSVFVGKDVPADYQVDDEDPEHNQDKWENTCSKCGYGGQVICCEFPGCGKVWHYHCLSLKRAPRIHWCCPGHPEKKVEQLQKAACARQKKKKIGKGKVGKFQARAALGTQQAQKKKVARQSAPPVAGPVSSVKSEEKAAVVEPTSNANCKKESSGSMGRSTRRNPVMVTEPTKEGKLSGASTGTASVEIKVDPVPESIQKRRSTNTCISTAETLPHQPPQKRLRVGSIAALKSEMKLLSTVSSEVTVMCGPLPKSTRTLRSSQTRDSDAQEPQVSRPCTPSVLRLENQKAGLLQQVQHVYETPNSAVIIRPIDRRRRRCNSIPANANSIVSPPSTPAPPICTRSKRSRRSVEEPLGGISTWNLDLPSLRNNMVSDNRLVILGPMSRRRSRSNKVSEPLNTLALNPCVPPRDPQPVNLNNTLDPIDKHVRMATRSASNSGLETSSQNNPVPNGDYPVSILTAIKQEPIDHEYEEDSYSLQVNLEESRNKQRKAQLDTASDTSSNLSLRSIIYEEADTDDEITVLFDGFKEARKKSTS